MLDILEDWLVGRGWGYQRIDGGVGSYFLQSQPALVPLILHKIGPAYQQRQLAPCGLSDPENPVARNPQPLVCMWRSLSGASEAHRCVQQPDGGLFSVPPVDARRRTGHQPRHC